MTKENILRIFSRMPTLETERLILRPMRVSDAADMYAYAKDPEVTRYLLWRPHPNVEYTRSYLEFLGGRYRIGSCYEWAVVLKETGHMIGTCGFSHIDCANRVAEIGYVLNPQYRGQGLAPEAVCRTLQFGFQALNLHRIEARYMLGNDASRKVMEKVGMQFEGVHRHAMLIKGEFTDIGMCAILSTDR